MSSNNIPFDEVTKMHIVSNNPVETFDLKWDIMNFSKFDRGFDEVRFATAGNSLHWQLVNQRSAVRLRLLNEAKNVSVSWKYWFELTDGKTTLEKEGHHFFCTRSPYTGIAKVFEITDASEFLSTHLLLDDCLTFHCTMLITDRFQNTVEMFPYSKVVTTMQKLSDDLKCLLQQQKGCDFAIHIGEEKFPVHKAILCARSTVFDRMFHYSMIENSQNHVEIDDIDMNTFRDFLTFLYAGEIEIPSLERAVTLYYASDKYEVQDLQNACSEYIKFHLCVNEVCNVLILSDRHGDKALKNVAITFAQMHASFVKETPEWAQLIKLYPKLALETLI